MKAFIEWIWHPVCIVRSGEDCDEYGKDYKYAVAIAIPWGQFFWWLLGGVARCVPKGLVADDARPLAEKMEHARAGHDVLKANRLVPKGQRIRRKE